MRRCECDDCAVVLSKGPSVLCRVCELLFVCPRIVRDLFRFHSGSCFALRSLALSRCVALHVLCLAVTWGRFSVSLDVVCE